MIQKMGVFMTELARLASLLIDLQKKDQLPIYATPKEALQFSIDHGYGDLALEVRRLWEKAN
ncbi:hypothetical protein ATX04_01825 [Oenococcus oeni]|nr:hypothetical protein ATW66_02175 [Oenococcus oeni]OIL30161.1 hypothetical protein ATX04_01825 [Oenococcus oeni]OIL82025.1 hypothetical protein ATX37_02315 [Oenococcus oeni]OIM46833.1 hypothetical protein ATX75_02460 [Oenococcus oeni]OIM73506.1 hypothetical protein ATX90_02480 [Oenococcus oeni]